jgi:hypothetical protein
MKSNCILPRITLPGAGLALWLCLTAVPLESRAQCSCDPALGQLDLSFGRTFQGTYRPGEPYDVMTIGPEGGDTFEELGIRLRIQVVCSCGGAPIAGIPAASIRLFFPPGSCWCPDGHNYAAHDTDANGWTEFSGPLSGGACGQSLTLFVAGTQLAILPIKTNSPDFLREDFGLHCLVDQGDLSAFAAAFGQPQNYSICFDFNESGTVDASDLAQFAAALGDICNFQ